MRGCYAVLYYAVKWCYVIKAYEYSFSSSNKVINFSVNFSYPLWFFIKNSNNTVLLIPLINCFSQIRNYFLNGMIIIFSLYKDLYHHFDNIEWMWFFKSCYYITCIPGLSAYIFLISYLFMWNWLYWPNYLDE